MTLFMGETNLRVLSNPSLYLLYYAKACNDLAEPISVSLRLRVTQLPLKKFRSSSEPLATLGSI